MAIVFVVGDTEMTMAMMFVVGDAAMTMAMMIVGGDIQISLTIIGDIECILEKSILGISNALSENAFDIPTPRPRKKHSISSARRTF